MAGKYSHQNQGERTTVRSVASALAAALVPALFFVALEGSLRLGGYGVNTDLVLELEDDPTHTCYLNGDAGRRYFSPALRAIQPSTGFRTFSRQKEPGSLRVFVMGESTVAGFPFHVNASFAGFLEDDLRAAYPNRTIEVINCGMSAISSYTVLDFVKQLVAYDPDLFLIYLGHNEFYGTLGAGSTSAAAMTRGVTLFKIELAKLRTYQLVSSTIFDIRKGLARGGGPEGRSLMASMIREKRIRMEDPIHARAEEAFRANLDEILDVAAKHRVPVILSTLASNLRDFPPFDSAHQDGFDAAQGKRIEDAIASGQLGEMDAAVALDTTYAIARFALARALDSDTLSARARREYMGARDHDIVHFRACSRFNEIIRQAAASRRTPLVDMDAALAAASAGGIPGSNLFLEHLHPNLRGVIAMAAAFRAQMVASKFIAASDAPARSYQQTLYDAAITPLDIDLARQRVGAMTGQWPFQKRHGDLAAGFPSASPEVAKLAEQVLHKTLTLDRAHEMLGQDYLKREELEPALAEFRALAKIYSISPTGHLNAGNILIRLRRPAEALTYYQAATALAPDDVEPRWRLALALHLTGNDEAAEAECRRVLTAAPGHAAATKLMQEMGKSL